MPSQWGEIRAIAITPKKIIHNIQTTINFTIKNSTYKIKILIFLSLLQTKDNVGNENKVDKLRSS